MKISHNPVQPFNQYPGKSQTARARVTDSPGSNAISDTATANTDKAIPAGRKEIPPGLERLQARLQAAPVEDLSKGQINAMAKINRNVARYLEVQAMATPTTPPAASPATEPVETPATTPAVDSGNTDTSSTGTETGNTQLLANSASAA